MGKEILFPNLVTADFGIQPSRHFVYADKIKLGLAKADGTIAVQASREHDDSLRAIKDLMKEVGAATDGSAEDLRLHRLFGANVREPIRTLLRYKAWTGIFFDEDPREPTEDNKLPVDQPIGAAFLSSPEGTPKLIRLGNQQWLRPDFFETNAALEVPWKVLQMAAWNILGRRMEETADEMARRKDEKTKTVLQAAIDAMPGHELTVSGGLMTKSAIDQVIIASTRGNFPITQAAINPARLLDMSGWTNGSTSALPYIWGPSSKADEMFRNLWADGYGNIRWFVSANVPYTEIWLGGEPENIGYHQTRGGKQTASDVHVLERVDIHAYWDEDAYVVMNGYPLWKITITA